MALETYKRQMTGIKEALGVIHNWAYSYSGYWVRLEYNPETGKVDTSLLQQGSWNSLLEPWVDVAHLDMLPNPELLTMQDIADAIQERMCGYSSSQVTVDLHDTVDRKYWGWR